MCIINFRFVTTNKNIQVIVMAKRSIIIEYFSMPVLILSRNRLSGIRKDSINRRHLIFIVGSSKFFGFDSKLWWRENGDIIRQSLEGGGASFKLFDGDDQEEDDIVRNGTSSCSSNLLRRRFEETYSSDVMYQDLFIETPPSRDVLKHSLNIIHQYWEIELNELRLPVVRTMQSSLSGHVVVRVRYSITQRPRFLKNMSSKLSLFSSVHRASLFDYKYEGWVDLYLRPTGDDDGIFHFNDWEVYRHDDRFLVYLPPFIYRYINDNSDEKGMKKCTDMLTIIEKIPLISTIFRWFRILHGRMVELSSDRKKRK